MQPIDVPREQLAGLCQYLNPTPFFEALIRERKPSGVQDGRSDARRPAQRSSVAVEVNATIATSHAELRAAGDLVMRRYAWRGYTVDSRALDCPAPGVAKSSAITLIASDGSGGTVGTLTLGMDGPKGLRVDDGFGAEIELMRAAGRRVCELTGLAVDKGVDSTIALASLFSLAFFLIRVLHHATDIFIEVNPRHVAFYERALGFVVAASEGVCERVKAPSVLLRLEIEKLEARLREYGFGGIDECLFAS